MTAPFSDSPLLPASLGFVELARAYVAGHHPDASASILGGSAAAGTAASTSDLDTALLYPSGHLNYAATTRYTELVEAFVHTPESLEFWYHQEAAERRPVIPDLCAQGILLTDDGVGEQRQSRAREHMAQARNFWTITNAICAVTA